MTADRPRLLVREDLGFGLQTAYTISATEPIPAGRDVKVQVIVEQEKPPTDPPQKP